jgi:hypothetical protein
MNSAFDAMSGSVGRSPWKSGERRGWILAAKTFEIVKLAVSLSFSQAKPFLRMLLRHAFRGSQPSTSFRSSLSELDQIKCPAAWVRTEDLECELWNAIAEDFSQPLDEVTDYDDDEDLVLLGDEFEDEEELRGSLLR